MKLLTLVLALSLTACGAEEQLTDEQKQDAISIPETAEGIPDFSRWQTMPNTQDICFQAEKDAIHCISKFIAGDKNCSNATFKFITKFDGYMHIHTVENVFIRQNEYHGIEFQGEHETHNIQDQYAVEAYHVFRCYGANGEVVRL